MVPAISSQTLPFSTPNSSTLAPIMRNYKTILQTFQPMSRVANAKQLGKPEHLVNKRIFEPQKFGERVSKLLEGQTREGVLDGFEIVRSMCIYTHA